VSPIVIFILLLAVMVALGALIVYDRLRRQPKVLSVEDKALVHIKWHELEQMLKKGGPAQLKQAVIDGDKLVDHCLKGLGIPGDSMGERLRRAKPKFSDYHGLWQAHKSRNQVVHETSKELLSFEAKQAVSKFKQALTDLGVL
jgi:hypothetical protein